MCIQTYHLRSLNLHLGMIDFLTEAGYKEALKFFFHNYMGGNDHKMAY